MNRPVFSAILVFVTVLPVLGCATHAPMVARPPDGARWFTYHQRFVSQTSAATSSTTNNVTTTTVINSANRSMFTDKVDAPQDTMILQIGDTVTAETLAGRQSVSGFGYQP